MKAFFDLLGHREPYAMMKWILVGVVVMVALLLVLYSVRQVRRQLQEQKYLQIRERALNAALSNPLICNDLLQTTDVSGISPRLSDNLKVVQLTVVGKYGSYSYHFELGTPIFLGEINGRAVAVPFNTGGNQLDCKIFNKHGSLYIRMLRPSQAHLVHGHQLRKLTARGIRLHNKDIINLFSATFLVEF